MIHRHLYGSLRKLHLVNVMTCVSHIKLVFYKILSLILSVRSQISKKEEPILMEGFDDMGKDTVESEMNEYTPVVIENFVPEVKSLESLEVKGLERKGDIIWQRKVDMSLQRTVHTGLQRTDDMSLEKRVDTTLIGKVDTAPIGRKGAADALEYFKLRAGDRYILRHYCNYKILTIDKSFLGKLFIPELKDTRDKIPSQFWNALITMTRSKPGSALSLIRDPDYSRVYPLVDRLINEEHIDFSAISAELLFSAISAYVTDHLHGILPDEYCLKMLKLANTNNDHFDKALKYIPYGLDYARGFILLDMLDYIGNICKTQPNYDLFVGQACKIVGSVFFSMNMVTNIEFQPLIPVIVGRMLRGDYKNVDKEIFNKAMNFL